MAVEFNPFLPEVIEDPYPIYEMLRREAPVYEMPGMNIWILSRYEDNAWALRNPETFSSTAILEMLSGDFNPIPDDDGVMMMNSDPPDHTRLRRLVSHAFTPQAVAELESSIEGFVDESIAAVAGRDEFDFVEDIAKPLPTRTFFTLLGVPAEDHQAAKDYTTVAGQIPTVMLAGADADPAWVESVRQSQLDYGVFIHDFVKERRQHPGDDLATALIAASDDDDSLSEIEVLKMIHLLITAGTESTWKLMSNMMLAFLRNPAQYELVRADPSLIPNAVQETLRYDGSALHMGRGVTQDVELSGTTIPAGAKCLISYGSANRDQERFPNPDEFDVTRDTKGLLSHLGFGYGIHRCLGAKLATLQTEVLLRKLIENYSGFSWDSDRVVRDMSNFLIRGVHQIPVSPR